jgi:hypothetical protein
MVSPKKDKRVETLVLTEYGKLAINDPSILPQSEKKMLEAVTLCNTAAKIVALKESAGVEHSTNMFAAWQWALDKKLVIEVLA